MRTNRGLDGRVTKKVNEAYEHLVASGQLTEAQVRVCQVMFSCRFMYPEGMTAREINMWLKHDEGRGHSGVHSRLRELAEIDMVVKDGKRKCTVSRREVNCWRLGPGLTPNL